MQIGMRPAFGMEQWRAAGVTSSASFSISSILGEHHRVHPLSGDSAEGTNRHQKKAPKNRIKPKDRLHTGKRRGMKMEETRQPVNLENGAKKGACKRGGRK